MKDEVYEQEPYMGQISASRIHGDATSLYGSPIKHGECISIEITGSKRQKNLGRDWYSNTDHICEVWLSPAQWADFLTRMNVGGGVPCTIRFDQKRGFIKVSDVPDPPELELNDGSIEVLDSSYKRLTESIDMLNKLVAKGKAGKTELLEVLNEVALARDHIKPNFQYATKCLKERAATFMTSAKHEIAALMESVGLGLLNKQIDSNKNQKELEPGEQ